MRAADHALYEGKRDGRDRTISAVDPEGLVDRFGYPIAPLHEGSTTDRTDFDRCFAGWYVTGTSCEPCADPSSPLPPATGDTEPDSGNGY